MPRSADHLGADLIMSVETELLAGRIGGILLILGAIVMFTGAAIPFLTHLGGEAWTGLPGEVMSAVARGPGLWRWANGLIAVAALITVLGLAGAVRLFWSDGPLALAGLATFVVATGLEITSRTLNMSVYPWAAAQGKPAATVVFEGLYELSESLIQGFILIAFVALVLFGIAALQYGAGGLGALLVVFGVIGIFLEIVGAAIPALVFMGTGALGIWMLAIARPSGS
ncbi:MAG: hypothetical protein R3258_00215 [Acidimicrobiia bacterium]|nr:hypothetical protein [Acidimicrobiia bacterium]